MKPPRFDYLAAGNAEEALDALAEAGEDARVLAGGQSLIAMLNMRLVDPGLIVDVARTEDLRAIEVEGDTLRVGAAVTQAELLAWPGLAERVPLLAKALPHVGHVQTRNKGTVCGSLAHADPSSELPLCLAVLGGEVALRTRRGRRTLSAAEFQTGMLSTAREADELVAEARFPLAAPGVGYAFEEFGMRHGDFAIVAAAAVADGEAVTLGIGGVADRPAVRRWDRLDEGEIDDALNETAWELGAADDQHASARFRRDLVRTLGRRTIEEARRCRG